jgi:hypothetical protein
MIKNDPTLLESPPLLQFIFTDDPKDYQQHSASPAISKPGS